jgi:hypothetical protein
VHQQDSEFSALRHLNIVAVDPGAVDLISAVRLHNTEEAVRQLVVPVVKLKDETYKQRRRRLLSERMFEIKRSTFTLSNKEWQAKTGKLLNRQRLLALSNAKNMKATYLQLAESSSRTGFADVYLLHVQARIKTSVSMQTWMKVKMTRRWKFQAYQKEQRAVTKLVTSLLGGLNAADTIVVWGNGGFGPTSQGHAPAPNKKLQSQLAKHVPVVVGSEHRSSITSACHHGTIVPISNKRCPGHRRHTVVKCSACCTMLSRDANAAHVIADIFTAMKESSSLPVWITDTCIRETNSNFIGATFS